MHEALSSHAASQAAHEASSRASPIGRHIRNNSSFDFYGTTPLDYEDEDDEQYDLGISAQYRRPKLSAHHRLLLLRLRPLLSLEAQLLRALLPDSEGLAGSKFGLEGSWTGTTAWRNEQPDYPSYPDSTTGSRSLLRSYPSSSALDEISIPVSLSPHNVSTTSPITEATPPITSTQSIYQKKMDSIYASARSPLGKPSLPLGGSSISPVVMKQIGPFPDSRPGSLRKDRDEVNGGGTNPSFTWNEDTRYRRNIASPTPSGYESGDDVPERLLATCAMDILSLWNDTVLRNLLCGPLATGGLGLKLHEDAGL